MERINTSMEDVKKAIAACKPLDDIFKRDHTFMVRVSVSCNKFTVETQDGHNITVRPEWTDYNARTPSPAELP